MKTLIDHLAAAKEKKILSLDGGGIRGALTIGYLEKIESILREKYQNKNYVLSDYFDLIGGTSTGSIIASCLAIGMTVEEIRDKYLLLGEKIFSKKYNWIFSFRRRIKAQFNDKYLIDELKNTFGEITIGSGEIKTGLCIVTKRIDTNSTWFLLNHPKGLFYDFNRNIPLWQALRASCAAPSYFTPQTINVGGNEIGTFIDGGVSLSNNPCLALLMISTLKGYPFQWELNQENMFLVSIGTGNGIFGGDPLKFLNKNLLYWAKNIANIYIQDSIWQTQSLMQWFTNSQTSTLIDAEAGNLEDDLISEKPLLKYLRYNCELSENYLNTILNYNFNEKQVISLLNMSNSKNRDILYEIGKKDSHLKVKESHF